MSEELTYVGQLFISAELLSLEQWMRDQAVAAAWVELRKYPAYDGYLKPTGTRTGDFSLVISKVNVIASVVAFIGIPGKQRAAITQEMYVKV